MTNQDTNFEYPLDNVSINGTYKEFNADDELVRRLNDLYIENHNCNVTGLIYDQGVFTISLNGDISWFEKVSQLELFPLEYTLLTNWEEDWIIIDNTGYEVNIDHLLRDLRSKYRFYPVTLLTRKLIWDDLNKYFTDRNAPYRVSQIFLNKQEGSCKVVVKNLKQDIE